MPSGYTQVPNVLSHLPVDWVVIGVFTLVVVILSLRMGTQLAAALALAAPVAVFAFNAVSSTAFISGVAAKFSTGTPAAPLFTILFAVFFFITYRIIGSYGMTGAYPMQAFLSGVAATIIVLVFWLQVPALSGLWHFGPQVQAVFSQSHRLFWLIGAYFALAFVRR